MSDSLSSLARAYGVSPRTVQRAGEFAEAVELLTRTVAPELERQIMRGQNRTPRRTIVRAARLVATDPAAARRLVDGGRARPTARPRCPHCGQPMRDGAA